MGGTGAATCRGSTPRRWPERVLDEGAHQPRALSRGDAAALHERLPGPEVDGVADRRVQQGTASAAGAPSGHQQPDHLVELALDGRQGVRKRRDELDVTQDVPPHVGRLGVVVIQLGEGRLEPHRRICLAPQRGNVGERVQFVEVR